MPDNLEPTTTPDQHLVAATLQGDISSFGIIVERYWNMAVALARTRISDAAEAEDIAQESFIRAYSHLHKLRNPCRFAGWLTKIVIQQCVDSIRGKGCSRIVSSCETSTLEQLAPVLAPGANPGLPRCKPGSHGEPKAFRQARRQPTAPEVPEGNHYEIRSRILHPPDCRKIG